MPLPTSAIVFGIVNLLFGVLGICAGSVNVALFFVQPDGNPLNERLTPAAWALTYFNVGMTIVTSVWLLTTGIGLLLRQNWARIGTILYGWYSLAHLAIVFPLNYLLVTQPLMAAMRQKGDQTGATALLIGTLVGAAIGGTIALGYAVLATYLLGRPQAALAFRGEPPRAAAPPLASQIDTGNPYQSPQ